MGRLELPDDCVCGHRRTIHQYGGDGITEQCLTHGCPCTSFLFKEILSDDIQKKLKRIAVHRLLYKPNAVSGMNPLVVMSLTYYYRSGVLDAEPITVKREGENYRIMDGRHRAVASMIAGRPDVLAEIE